MTHHMTLRRQFPTHRFLPGLGFVGTGFTPTFSPGIPSPPMYAGGGSTPTGATMVAATMKAQTMPGATQPQCIPGAVCNTGDPYTSGIVDCTGGVPRCVATPQFHPPMSPAGAGAGITTPSASNPANGDGSPSIHDAADIAPDLMGGGAGAVLDDAAANAFAQGQMAVSTWSSERKFFTGVAIVAALATALAWKTGFKMTAYGSGAAAVGAAWVAWKQPVFISK